jgi:hypothetical protein
MLRQIVSRWPHAPTARGLSDAGQEIDRHVEVTRSRSRGDSFDDAGRKTAEKDPHLAETEKRTAI